MIIKNTVFTGCILPIFFYFNYIVLIFITREEKNVIF